MTLILERHEQKKSQLFENLSEDSLKTLLQHALIQQYESGRLLVQQGDAPHYMYLILEGSLKTMRMGDDGHEVTIRMLEAGDTCMEAVLFMGGPSPVNVQTANNPRLLLIPEKIVKSYALENPQFAINLLRIVTRHYKNALLQIDAMNIKSPLQRVGYYFLLKHLEQGPENPDIKLPFKKKTVANYLGMTPETFSRTLKQMTNIGIKVEKDIIRMQDSYALCDFCDFDVASKCSRHDKGQCKKYPLD